MISKCVIDAISRPVLNTGGGGVRGQVFKFWCLKWHILTEMTAKYGNILIFLANKGGIHPPVVLSGGSGTPPGGNPVV